jgi:hypothetical protein
MINNQKQFLQSWQSFNLFIVFRQRDEMSARSIIGLAALTRQKRNHPTGIRLPPLHWREIGEHLSRLCPLIILASFACLHYVPPIFRKMDGQFHCIYQNLTLQQIYVRADW